MTQLYRLQSIAQIHEWLKMPPPEHPLISIFQHNEDMQDDYSDINFVTELYMISYKKNVCGSFNYGRQSYDFQQGTLVFTAPEQVISAVDTEFKADSEGWTIMFHPDLIRPFELGRHIDKYTFFSYEVFEALHVSETERNALFDLVQRIKTELKLNIDQHSHRLISSTLGLLLDYCARFFDRQFCTRLHVNQDVVGKFEGLLHSYYEQQHHLELGIPTVAYCGKTLGISPNYLSDLLRKETGKSAIEHIHSHILDKAKTALLQDNIAVGQLAYDLGFDYPSHFSKLFKKLTGESPNNYRKTH
ncbi:MAG: helix-turn-helix domain-containing protein [Psychrobium sp.]